LNVAVNTLESDISASFNVAVNQAVQQGFVTQTDANHIAEREANLITSGSGFIFDIDEFPSSSVAIPVTGATLTPSATPTEEEVTATPTEEEGENDKDENSKVESQEEEKEESAATESAEDKEQHEIRPSSTPSSNNNFTATPLPSMTPTPTLVPTQPEDFSLFYAP
jgi:hypothetical protein